MTATPSPWRMLETAEPIYSAAELDVALERLAAEITDALGRRVPLVLAVMQGAVVFAGRLLPLLHFPLEFGYVHATRYRGATQGGDLHWLAWPQDALRDRVVLVLDDILDEGATLAAIRDRLLREGAAACYSAVLVDKAIGRPRPVAADFVGVTVPDRYVFGFGMDINGWWRNLPGIYALGSDASLPGGRE